MKALKRTIAAIMSLVIVGGAAPVIPGGFTALKPITASAADDANYTWQNVAGDWLLNSDNFQLDLRSSTLYIWYNNV